MKIHKSKKGLSGFCDGIKKGAKEIFGEMEDLAEDIVGGAGHLLGMRGTKR